jgi:hypothetical protein
MPEELPYSEPDDLARYLLYRDNEIVCEKSWKIRVFEYAWPMWFFVILAAGSILQHEALPPRLIKIGVIFLAITAAWAVLIFVGDLRSPQRVRIRGDRLIVEWWFGKKKEFLMSDIDIDSPANGSESGTYTLKTDGFAFRLHSSMKNFAVLVDAVETTPDRLERAAPIRPT